MLPAVDFIKLSRLTISAYFAVYGLLALIYPRPYADSIGRYGFAIFPTLIFFAISFGVGRRPVLSGLFLFFFMQLVEYFDWCLSDQLEWAYLGWTLIAFVLLEWGVKKAWLIELGWWVGAVTFWLQGVAKVLNTGGDWIHGRVMGNILYYVFPKTYQILLDKGFLWRFTVAMGAFTLFFHLTALPLTLWRPGRKFFWAMAILFHTVILLSPLAFVSFGMFGFWFFIAESFSSRGAILERTTG